MNKAYRPFWACKGTFGKTWGLKPRVVCLFFTMVIRLVLICGSTAWCVRVRYNVSRTEVGKLQRLVWLAITGVIRMTPAAAVEILLGLSPLRVMIEVEAQAKD
jgi:hypothetical protein